MKKTRRELVWCIAATMAIALGGCPGFITIKSGGSGDGIPLMTGAYDGPECEAHIEVAETREYHSSRIRTQKTYERYWRTDIPQANTPLDVQLMKLTCSSVLLTPGSSDEVRETHKKQHAAFDMRNFDQFRAASMVIACRKLKGQCLDGYMHVVRRDRVPNPYVEASHKQKLYRPMEFADRQKYDFGMFAWYADRVDTAKLRVQIAQIQVPEAARAAFIAEFEDARAFMNEALAVLSPIEREVYVDIPNRVRAERQAYYSTHRGLYKTLTEAKEALYAARDAGNIPDAAIEAVEATRTTYLAGCGKIECLRDPFVHETSEALFYAHLARGDAVSATLESSMISPRSQGGGVTNIERISFSIYLAQNEAMHKSLQAQRKFEAAMKQGMDEKTARSTLQGVEPFGFDRRSIWKIDSRTWSAFIPNYKQFIPKASSSLRKVEGTVRQVRKKGDKAEIIFSDKIRRYEDYDCVDTRVIERITSSGQIVYRQRCKSRGMAVQRTKIDSITVPARDAAKLRPGERVLALVLGSDRSGRIRNVWKDDALVQLRAGRATLKR